MIYRNAGIQSIEEAIKRLIDGEDLRSGTTRLTYKPEYLREGESPFRVIYADGNEEPIKGLWRSVTDWQTPIDPLKESTREKPVLAYRWDGKNRPAYPRAEYVYYDASDNTIAPYKTLTGQSYIHAEIVPMSDCAEWEGDDE